MVADPVLFLSRLRLVDGIGTGVQRSRGYHDADDHQPCILLAHPDTIVMVACHSPWLAAIWCVLGCVYFGNLSGLVHLVAIHTRELEDV